MFVCLRCNDNNELHNPNSELAIAKLALKKTSTRREEQLAIAEL